MRFFWILILLFSAQNYSLSQLAISGPTNVCAFECYTYSLNEPGPAFWTVEGGLVDINQGEEIEICWEDVLEGNIRISGFDPTVSLANLMVVISELPAPNIGYPQIPICQTQDSINFQEDLPNSENCRLVCGGSQVFYNAFGFDDSNFEWFIEGANNTNITNDGIEISWPDEGFGSIMLVEETMAGCRDTSFTCIEIMPKPQLSIIHSNNQIDLSSVCQNQTIYLESESNDAANFTWLSSDGQVSEGPFAEFSYQQAGSYQVTLIATTDCLCQVETEITINVIDFISPTIDCTGTICSNSEVTYFASDICGEYIWDIQGDASILEGGADDDNFITLNWGSGPVGFVGLSTISCDDANICSQAAFELIPIIDPSIIINGPNEVCSDDLSIFYAPPYQGTDYNWKITGGNGQIVEGQGTNQIKVKWLPTFASSQNALIELDLDNCTLECSSYGSKNVVIKDPFELYVQAEYCEGQTAYFNSFSGYNNASVDWFLITPDQNVHTLAQGQNFADVELTYGTGYHELYAVNQTDDFCNEEFRTGFIVMAQPDTPALIEGPEYVCLGEGYQYSVKVLESNLEFHWTINDGGNLQQLQGEDIFVEWTSSGPFELSVEVFSTKTGCTSEVYTENYTPADASSIVGDNIVCHNAFSNYKLEGVEGFDVTWNTIPSDAGSILELADGEISVQWHETGIHSLVAEYCGNSYNLDITITDFSFAVVNPDGLCEGQFGEINVNPPTGGSFRVFNELGTFLGDSNPIDVGPGYYGIEVYDINGCQAYSSIYIDSYNAPPINISSTEWGNLCTPGGTALIEALSTNEGLSYQWYHNGLPIGGNSSQITINDEDNYSLEVTDQNGCTNQMGVNLECVQSRCDCRPDGGVSFSYNRGTRCDDFDFTNTSVAYIAGSLTYDFGDPDSGASNSSTLENPSHRFSKAGHFLVQLSGTVPSATDPTETCAARFVDVVTVEMVADFDYIPGCSNSPIEFIDLSNYLPDYSISNYLWEFDDPSSGLNNTSSDPNPTHEFTSGGMFEVTLTTTSNTGCISQIKKNVIVHEGPAVDFSYSTSTCSDKPVQFFSQGTTPIYLWDFDDNPNQYSVSQHALHHFHNAGSYNVSFFGENIYGCRTEVAKTIEVFDNLLAGEINMDKSMPICDGEQVNLDAPAGGIAYLWNTGETTSTISTDQAGIYMVTVSSFDGCEYIPEPVLVNVIRPLNPVIQGYVYDPSTFNYNSQYEQLEICENELFELFVGWIPNANAYEWSSGQTNSFLQANETSGLPVGNHEYTITVTHTTSGCQIASEPFEVIVHPIPDAFNIESDQSTFCEGVEFTFSVINPNPDLRYFWNNGAEGNSIKTTSPGEYFAEAINQFGCIRQSNRLRINPLPIIDRMLTGCQELCFPDTLCVANSSSSTSYQWFLDGVAIVGSEGNAPSIQINEVGDYQVLLENTYGCTVMSDILSISPETKDQKLSGIVFIDSNNNNIHDPGEELLENVPVNLFSGNTSTGNTNTDANGFYEFDPLPTTTGMVVIDTTGLSLNSGQGNLFYDFELKSCIEELNQDFPLNKDCTSSTFDLTLFTCPNEQVEYENNLYSAYDTETITMIDADGCESTINLEVLPYEIDEIQLMTSNSCSGQNSGEVTVINYPLFTTNYSLDGGQTVNYGNTFNNLAAGNYTITTYHENGCITEHDFEIIESEVPNIIYTSEGTCPMESNGSLFITNNSTSNLSFAIDDLSNMTEVTTINNLSAGSHILYVVDPEGCLYEYNFEIDLMNIPIPDFTTENTCSGMASGSLEIDNNTSVNWTYAVDDPNSPVSNTVFNNLEVGEHTLYTFDENGCSGTQIFEINAYAEPELSLETYDSCAGQYLGAIFITTDETNLEFSIDGVNFSTTQEFLDLQIGDHILYVETADNCVFELPFTIGGYEPFAIDIITKASCVGQDNGWVEFINTENLSYSIDGLNFQADPFFENLASGDYTIFAQDENLCPTEIEITIEEIETTDIEFNDPVIECSTQEVELISSAINPSSEISYQWSTGETAESIIVGQSGIYELEINDGCSIRSQIWDIQFDEEHGVQNPAYMPNIFTPDSSDGNQELKPLLHEEIDVISYRFTIFDRWGNKLFDSTNNEEFWNGFFQNEDINPGVFVWRIELEYTTCEDPILYEKYGDVTLLK